MEKFCYFCRHFTLTQNFHVDAQENFVIRWAKHQVQKRIRCFVEGSHGATILRGDFFVCLFVFCLSVSPAVENSFTDFFHKCMWCNNATWWSDTDTGFRACPGSHYKTWLSVRCPWGAAGVCGPGLSMKGCGRRAVKVLPWKLGHMTPQTPLQGTGIRPPGEASRLWMRPVTEGYKHVEWRIRADGVKWCWKWHLDKLHWEKLRIFDLVLTLTSKSNCQRKKKYF